MKNFTIIKKEALLTGLLTIFFVSAKAQDVNVYAYAFTSEPKIDGYIDKEWDDNDFLEISNILSNNKTLAKDDFSGSFKISWYNNKLYFLFVITDDSLVYNEGRPIWLGDNINLYLDLGNEKEIQYDNNDYLCHFKWGNSEYYERYNGDDLIQINNSSNAIEFAQTCDTINHVFIMEIAIHNLAELNGPSVLDEETSIGLDAGIYDCDDEIDGFFSDHLSWIDTTGYAWSDPSKLGTAGFGTATLKAAKIASTPRIPDKVNLVQIYPTIASQTLNIRTNSVENLNFQLFDLCGNKVASEVLASVNSRIDVSMLKSGLYIAQVYSSKKLLNSQKIIIER